MINGRKLSAVFGKCWFSIHIWPIDCISLPGKRCKSAGAVHHSPFTDRTCSLSPCHCVPWKDPQPIRPWLTAWSRTCRRGPVWSAVNAMEAWNAKCLGVRGGTVDVGWDPGTKVSHVIYSEETNIYCSRFFKRNYHSYHALTLGTPSWVHSVKRIAEVEVKNLFSKFPTLFIKSKVGSQNIRSKALSGDVLESTSCRQKQYYWATGLFGLKHGVNLWSEYIWFFITKKASSVPPPGMMAISFRIECCGVFCHTRARQSPMFIESSSFSRKGIWTWNIPLFVRKCIFSV